MSLQDKIEVFSNDMKSAFKLIQVTNEKKRLLNEIEQKQARIKEIDKFIEGLK